MDVTRRSFVLAAGGALVAGRRADAAAPILAWHDRNVVEHIKLRNDAITKGYRCLSQSVYGPVAAPAYASVMINRPNPVEQHEMPKLSTAELHRALDEEAKRGFGPVIISATGATENPLFAVVFEPQMSLSRTLIGMTSGDAKDARTIQAAIRGARIDGLYPRWVVCYGTAEQPAFAAIFAPNADKVVWNADGVSEAAGELQARLSAQLAGWRRPSVFAPIVGGRTLSVFVDSQIGLWQARFGLTAAQYQAEFDALVPKGYLPLFVQAAGASVGTARFAAVFAQRETPQERTFTARGPVANAGIDEVFRKSMMAQPLRQACVAIVKGTRLVYARGYTYAEPGWPLAEPTTLFRQASVSKTIAALAVFQLIEEKKLKLTDRMQDILALRTPNGAAATDPRFKEITIAQLLGHTSGLNANAMFNAVGVVQAFRVANQNAALPVTAAMLDSYVASLPLVTDPGAKAGYNNCGYYMLGRVVAKLRGAPNLAAAMQPRLFNPLKITRIRPSRSLVGSQQPDEARYGANAIGAGPEARLDIGLTRSVMSNDRPLVPAGYGEDPYEILEGSGGLSAAAVDLARLIAVWISPNDTPALKRETVTSMLDAGIANAGTYKDRSGYGLDAAATRGLGRYYGQKGGDLRTSQNVLQFNGEWGFAVSWASHLTDIGVRWYPNFPEIMGIATKADWGPADLFTNFNMPSL